MRIEDLIKQPGFLESFAGCRDGLDKLLTEKLIANADESTGGDNAQAEVGAMKQLASVIKILRAIAPAEIAKKRITTRPLRRFAGDTEKGAEKKDQ